eukprot:TRINITY_DN5294_c0_g1_i1.p1 TRINITY_DN5294_c0_g1~~TRINITY_DN5294_c0_g1_i1.p1  ORF type:complete len:108 (+),score=34.12 TRINITY_DN5294_c0_g1_i1:93-416(+)
MSLPSSFPPPQRIVLEGRYCRLEPLNESHLEDLYRVTKGQEERFKYLPEFPPKNEEELKNWFNSKVNSEEDFVFAVINKSTGRCEGRQVKINPIFFLSSIGKMKAIY